ncbi:nucleotide cyclase [Suillus paluster]|uniref:nucleotide cyclase n=1 Tax=Suillus paluster TaxID=48578 RepID=UPI001B884586|nr:nucleotide cyclase [Suillus paluster]KAG1744953.1 nucleotide cyclase [Suillus paluster]
MHSTTNSSSNYMMNRWGFDTHMHSNLHCDSKYLNLLHHHHHLESDPKQNNHGAEHAEDEHGNAPFNFSWLSHLPGFGVTDLLATHVQEETHRRVSHISTHTHERNGSLIPNEKEEASSTIYGHVKARLAKTIALLHRETAPPTGHLCLVFTDIRNSTELWEKNPAMRTAIHVHNDLLLRHLIHCGGYLVKTEGDAFMCTFPTTLAAVWWCLSAQIVLLHASWPSEILECDEGKEVYDAHGTLLARGLSVRMGIHSGSPLCETDPITGRMDYLGPVVNRAARICGSAAGGQIMCSANVVREIQPCLFEAGLHSEFQPVQATEAVRQMVLVPAGELKLKGLEIPELASLAYPAILQGRQDLVPKSPADLDTNGTAIESANDDTSSDDVFVEL